MGLRAVDALEERPCNLGIDPVVKYRVHHFMQRVEAGLVGVEGGDIDLPALHAAVLVVEMTVRGIAQRRGLALQTVRLELNAGAEGHCVMIFILSGLCQ
ncbi:MAG: hypothetical protein JWO20_461 [Candidatus Angelobacter sp.]|jgi:hypothetical protein|nr:hypothetical protein [Candidatus Angelobacter sp.]